MRKTILAALAATLLAAPAMAEGEWRPGVSNCRPTLEKWLATHERKFTNGYSQFGAFVAGELRWDGGSVVEVTVGPALDEAGHPAFCVIASRFISRPEQRAEVE